jgi:hypothetical protein
LLSLRHLPQHRFYLGEPEGRLHGTVEVDSGGQFGSSLLLLANLGVEGAKT